jgi:hypothetical protein
MNRPIYSGIKGRQGPGAEAPQTALPVPRRAVKNAKSQGSPALPPKVNRLFTENGKKSGVD